MTNNIDAMMTARQQTRARELIAQHYLDLRERFDALLKASAAQDKVAIEIAYGALTGGLRKQKLSALDTYHVCQYVYVMGNTGVPIELDQQNQLHDPKGDAEMVSKKTSNKGADEQPTPIETVLSEGARVRLALGLYDPELIADIVERKKHQYISHKCSPLDRPTAGSPSAAMAQDGDEDKDIEAPAPTVAPAPSGRAPVARAKAAATPTAPAKEASSAPATVVKEVQKETPAQSILHVPAFAALAQRIEKNTPVTINPGVNDKNQRNKVPPLSAYFEADMVLRDAAAEFRRMYANISTGEQHAMLDLIEKRFTQLGAALAAEQNMMKSIIRGAQASQGI